MAGRRKFHFLVGVRDPLDGNSVSMPGAGVTALVYPGSAPIVGAISGAGPYTVPVSHPGELRVGDLCAFVELATGTLVSNGLNSVTAIAEVTVTGSWELTLSNITVPGVLSNPTGYAVITPVACEKLDGPFEAPLNVAMSPVAITGTGLIEGYFVHPVDGSELRDVDIYVAGGGLNPGVFARNVPYGGNVQAVDLNGVAKATAANVTIDDDTGVVELTGVGPVQKFLKARPGRRLHVWTDEVSGTVSFATTSIPASDDLILGPTGATSVTLKQHRVYCLIGVVKSGFNVWMLDEALVDLDLDDPTNVTVVGTTVGSVLYCFAAGGTGQWVAAAAIGSLASGVWAAIVGDPATSYWRDQVGGFKYQIRPVSGGFTLDRTFRLPGGSATEDEIVTKAGNAQTITSEKTIHDDKLLIADPVDVTKKTRIDSGAVSASSTRVLSMADRDLDLAKLAAGRVIHLTFGLEGGLGALHDQLAAQTNIVNGIYILRPVYDIRLRRVACDSVSQASVAGAGGTLQLYRHTALPTTVATPPVGPTAMLSSAINLANIVTAGGRDAILDVTSFAVDTVPAGQYLFLSAVTAVTNTASPCRVSIVIEYEIV